MKRSSWVHEGLLAGLLAGACLFGASAWAAGPAAANAAAPRADASAGTQGDTADPSEMMRAGLSVTGMIDQGQTVDLWRGASPAARQRVDEDKFIAEIRRVRGSLGANRARSWVGLSRQTVRSDDAGLSGEYVSVEFETRFANKADAALHELVTFHLDNDRVWRFSGYVLR